MTILQASQRISLFFAVAALFPTPAFPGPLEDARAQTERVVSRLPSGSERCIPDIQGPADIHILRGYAGGKLVDPSLTAHPPRYSDVRVEVTERPVFLVLSNYNPAVWRINAADNAKIAGVYLTGYYEPMILGLPEGVPVGRASFRTRGGDNGHVACEDGSATTEASLDLARTSHDELTNLRVQSRKLQRTAKDLNEQIRVMEAVRVDLAEEPDVAPALTVLARKISDMSAERMLLLGKAAKIRNAEAKIWAKLKRVPKVTNRRGSDSFNFQRWAKFKTPSNVTALVDALAQRGSFKLASSQVAGDAKYFTVSDSAARSFSELKADGAKRLASLQMPQLDILPAEAPRMTAPAKLIARDGVNYLVKKGYLEQGGLGEVYYCEKRRLGRMAQGVPSKKPCKKKFNTVRYTILGPITIPAGLCGGHSITFLLPAGVAEPEGRSCHSPVIRLEDEPCLGDFGDCRMTQLRR